MRVLICVVVLCLATALHAAGWDPPDAEKVIIKWDGDYPHNTSKRYDNRRPINDLQNIVAGWTKNFENGTPNEQGKIAKAGELEGWIWQPKKANGPVPYVIFMHGCTGMYYTNTWVKEMADFLNGQGWGMLSLDSFTTRGVSPTCGPGDAHWGRRRVDDAYSALDYLIDHGLAKADEVYVMGHSNGGLASLLAMETRYLDRKHNFKAALPLEPQCITALQSTFYGPIFMVLAEKDEANDPRTCYELTKRKHAHPIQITTIKDSLHAYLFPGQRSYSTYGKGWRQGYDERGSRVGSATIRNFFRDPIIENKIKYE